jgi:hypothetical protein
MIIGSHTIIQSKNADADRAFLRDVLGLDGIDSGGGWLIFGLPPSELAVHPSSKNDVHEHYLICEDVQQLVTQLTNLGIACSPIQDQDWGRLTQIALPGGGKLGIYQALHARPDAPVTEKASKAAKKPAPAKAAKQSKPVKTVKQSKPVKTAKQSKPAKTAKQSKPTQASKKPAPAKPAKAGKPAKRAQRS